MLCLIFFSFLRFLFCVFPCSLSMYIVRIACKKVSIPSGLSFPFSAGILFTDLEKICSQLPFLFRIQYQSFFRFFSVFNTLLFWSVFARTMFTNPVNNSAQVLGIFFNSFIVYRIGKDFSLALCPIFSLIYDSFLFYILYSIGVYFQNRIFTNSVNIFCLLFIRHISYINRFYAFFFAQLLANAANNSSTTVLSHPRFQLFTNLVRVFCLYSFFWQTFLCLRFMLLLSYLFSVFSSTFFVYSMGNLL